MKREDGKRRACYGVLYAHACATCRAKVRVAAAARGRAAIPCGVICRSVRSRIRDPIRAALRVRDLTRHTVLSELTRNGKFLRISLDCEADHGCCGRERGQSSARLHLALRLLARGRGP